MKKLAVVIPFFQEEGGILRKAVDSAFQQELPPDVAVHIIVVDDASPVSAASELEGASTPERFELSVEKAERNGGPGAARNIGIDRAIAIGATYCAFLDSDDIWIGPHIENAVRALDNGHDVYFSDHRRLDDYGSGFLKGAPTFWGSEQVKFARGDEEREIFSISSSFIRSSLVQEYLFQTSTVAFRLDNIGNIRFDTRLRTAGEDHLFWFDLATAAANVAVSAVVEAECGFGVNVYFSSFSWESVRSANRYGYRYLMFCEMLSRNVSNKEDRATLKRSAIKMRNKYLYLVGRQSIRGIRPNWDLLRQITLRRLKNAAS
ncbi:MAG: glycosyltransferase family 2 protein [Novosphingobium sp.]